MKILRGGGAPKILDSRKGGSEKIVGLVYILTYTSKPTGEGGGSSQKIEQLARKAAKISSSEFQYLHRPCHNVAHDMRRPK